VTVSLDSCVDLVLRLALAQEQELFFIYKSKLDPDTKVYLYQSHFHVWTHNY